MWKICRYTLLPPSGYESRAKRGELDYECQRSKQTNESFQGVSVTLPASDNNGRPENICSADQFMNKSCGAGQFVNKTCGAGQFVKIKNGTGLKSCETCPDGTFMIKKRHSSLYCHSCQVSGPRDSLMGCISKKELPVIVGCLNHKWICHPANFNKDPSLRACCQCTTCQYVGMECTNTSDTKCCPRPNMTYVYGECHEEKQALADVTVSPILSNLCYMFLGFVVLVCIFLIVCY